MEKDSSIEINYKKIFLKNRPVTVFSVLTILSVIAVILSLAGSSFSIIGLFSVTIWILLFLAFLASTILAYYEKYTLMFLPFMIWLLITTVVVRTANVPQLKNVATGEWTLGPDLDPFLYLRNAQEITHGVFNKTDYFRQAPLGATSYITTNLMPWAIVLVYHVTKLFGTDSVAFGAIIAPVIFFTISVIGFFLFMYSLLSIKFSKIKALSGATIGSLLYAFAPSMIHRTVAGIPEIESLAMASCWFAFMFFVMAWKQEKHKKMITYGILSGIFTGIMSWSWGGYKYIYMTLGLVVFLCFLFNIEKKKTTTVFVSFAIPALILELLRIRSLGPIITSVSDTGFAIGIIFLLLVDYILFNTKLNKVLKLDKINLPRTIISFIFWLLILVLTLLILKPSMLVSLASQVVERMLYPFGRERVGLTVAENKAPYFTEVFANFGYLFWVFFASVILLFYQAIRHFSPKKKILLNALFVFFLLSFIFSRLSPDHPVLSGDTTISHILYFGGLILFAISLFYVYIKAHIKNDEKTLSDFSRIGFIYLLLIALSFWGIVSMRGAVRLFFIISPILIAVASYLPIKVYDYTESKNKTTKIISIIALVIISLLLLYTAISSIRTTTLTVPQIAPSVYNQQWQKAMDWVSHNTPDGSIFVHWWDYGYWIQTLGGRPTVTDGSHANGWWDHTTARYLLTTPHPSTALSLMKTYNVSYLLIDSSDLGKYSAYSSIGSDESGTDRLSWIPIMVSDSKQTQETASGQIRVYQGGSYLDEDIVYEGNNSQKIFLPANKAAVGGIILSFTQADEGIAFTQPTVAFIYNNQRIDLPARYVYYDGKLVDFGNGLNITLRIIPAVVQGEQGGVSVDSFGAIIYLSPKTMNSLFAELYLMDDPYNHYPTITIAHTEDDFIVSNLKQQGVALGDFVYYQGFRGPIKVWSVDYPLNTPTNPVFLESAARSGEWGALDKLESEQ